MSTSKCTSWLACLPAARHGKANWPLVIFMAAAIALSAAFIFVAAVQTAQDAQAAHCGTYTTQSMCTIYPECKWDTAGNHCYESTTTQTCAAGYYWDTATMMCKSSTTTTCPSGQLWDETTHMCKTSTTTQTCATGYYWDTATATCKISTTTTETCGNNFCGSGETATSCPVDCGTGTATTQTCAAGYYWDTATATCKVSTTTTGTCTGANQYMDPIKNICITQTTCSSGYYWDYEIDACKAGTTSAGCSTYVTSPTCTAITGCSWNAVDNYCFTGTTTQTCAAGSYFDYTKNACVTTQACATGQYWDYGKSMCVSSTACPAGQYWDATKNICLTTQTCPAGQYWDYGMGVCTSGSTCPSGQWWDYTANKCVVDCAAQATQASCTVSADCAWAGSYCYRSYTVPTGGCSTKVTQATCTTDPSCGWDATSNYCYSGGGTSCGYGYYWDTASKTCIQDKTTQTCPTGQWWDSWAKACKIDCGSQTTETACKISTECSWNTTYKYCSYGAPASTCSTGYHYHSESGGFCMNDQENYSGTCYTSDGKTTTTCPLSGGSCPVGSYWDPGKNICASDTSKCPSGYHFHSEDGGFCINDKEDYASTCYSKDGVTQVKCPAPTGYCPYPQYWNATTNVCESSTCPSGYHSDWDSTSNSSFCMNDQWNYDSTCYDIKGITKLSCPKPYGYCTSGQFWNEISKSCISNKCPASYHMEWDQAGVVYCMNDKWDTNSTCYKSDGVTQIKCPTYNYCPPPSYLDPATNTCVGGAKCAAGYHSHSESGGFCMNDQENYSGTCYDMNGTKVITCPTNTVTQCPAGFYYRWEFGGFCMNDQNDQKGTCYDSAGKTKISCPSETSSSLTVSWFDFWTEADGRLRVGIDFSKDADQSTLTSANVYLIKVKDGSKVEGSLELFPPKSFDFISKGLAEGGIDYQFIVKKTVKDLSGGTMAQDSVSKIFQVQVYERPTFYVDEDKNHPTMGDYEIPTNAKIHIVFSKDLDPASNFSAGFKMWASIAPAIFIPGKFTVSGNSFDFTPASALLPNTNYSYEIIGSESFPVPYAFTPTPTTPQTTSYIKAKDGTALQMGSSGWWFTTAAGAVGDGGKVTGKVTDGSGAVVLDAWVSVYTEDWKISKGANSGKDGIYTVWNVPAGAYLARVYAPSSNTGLISPDPVKISVAVGQTVTQNFSFVKSTKTIKGTVKKPDGSVVSGATIDAYRGDTGGYAQAAADKSGSYILSVTGGSWDVRPYPTSMGADWSYDKEATKVVFASDSTIETKTVDFRVTAVDAQITGKILLPDGTAPAQYSTWVSVVGGDNKWYGGEVDKAGTFTIRVAAGIYTVEISTQDQKYYVPSIPNVSVKSGQTYDLGAIKLAAKNEHIKGKVTDKSGKGIANVNVNAWVPEGYGYAWAMTGADGAYDLAVSPGRWELQAMADMSQDYYNPDPPKKVDVAAGATVTANFVLYTSDAGISGKIVDSKGNALSDLYGHVELMQQFRTFGVFSEKGGGGELGGFTGMGAGGPIERGAFSFKAAAGVYVLQVFLPPGSGYSLGESQTVTLTAGKTAEVKVTVSKNTSKITGVLKDKNGNTVTGVWASVFAESKSGTWQEASVDSSTGKYTLTVSSGTWYLGYNLDPSSGYVSGDDQHIDVVVTEGATVVKDLVVSKAGSKVTGQVTDPNGKGVSYIWVDISRKSMSGIGEFASGTFDNPFVAGGQTDEKGNFSIAVPAGTYYAHIWVPPYLGYLAPEEKQVTAPEGGSTTANFQLRKTDASIEGKMYVGTAPVGKGFVWAWSEKGGYQEATTNKDGSYKLSVAANSSWHIAGAADVAGDFYKANEGIVEVKSGTVQYDIYVTKFGDLPATAVKTADTSKPVAMQTQEGVSVVVPANSMGKEGSVTLTIAPDTRVANQGGTKTVVGSAYEISATDSTGKEVTKLNSNVEITIPYSEEDLKKLSMKEDSLALNFWDETAGVWKEVNNFVVNKETNTVTCTVDHFTRFAIVAAADVTAPSAPTAIIGTALGDGKIKVVWTNPTADFSHAKVYRSEASGILGSVRAIDLKTGEYTDTGVTDGKTYYYTVRAVDPAGNESTNITQTSVVAVGTSVEKKTGSVTIQEGSLIRGPDKIKVYIVNAFGFRRHIFNPAVFGMYKHFTWESIKDVTKDVLDSYTTSDVYRADVDPKVYSLEEVDEAKGKAIKHHLEMTAAAFVAKGYDWNQVFVVNKQERDYYETGAPLK